MSISGIKLEGGFYHYFKSKKEVLAESISNFADNLLNELEPLIEGKSKFYKDFIL